MLSLKLTRLVSACSGLLAKHTAFLSTLPNDMVFRQLFDKETFTFTYIVGCLKTRESVIIDPVFELVDRDMRVLEELDLKLKFAINTHVHADHVTGSGLMKKRLGPSVKSVIGSTSGAVADKHIAHGERLQWGSLELEARSTPGHTNGCTTFVMHSQNLAFTGDTLLIRGCGRTDFQQGSAATLFDSVHNQIFSLPKTFLLYPGHDYTGQSVSSVEEELKHNRRLTKSKEEFVAVMENLGLAYPKQIDRALPANLMCGVFDEG